MIRVHLSLQYPALDAGIRSLLAGDSEITIVDQDVDEGPQEDQDAADVYVMTSAVFMRDAEKQRGMPPDAGVVVLSPERMETRQLWANGRSWGILNMDASSEELSATIRAVAAGLIAGTPRLLQAGESNFAPGPLTEREVEVLGMLSRGLANKQIAVELGISEHTVKFHVSSIYTKLNVANRTEAVREGLRNGWITL